jgi:pimeloyl-ACP methyl ester carboxylesterase
MKEAVSFFSEGCKIAADFYVPKKVAPDTRLPAVLLCHGYTGLRHLYLPDTARMLNAAGYAALAFDYKGWGDSEGPRLRLDPHGRVADAQAALTYLSQREEVDANRIGLFGWSFGCSVGVWLAAIDPRVKSIVGVVGVANGRRWLKQVRNEGEWRELVRRSDEDRSRRMKTGQSEMVDRPFVLFLDPDSRKKSDESRKEQKAVLEQIPLEFVDETLNFNPEWVVDKIAPRASLFITCEKDLVVLPEESEELFRRAGEPKRLIVLKGCGHYDVYFGKVFHEVMKSTIDWFAGTLQ